MADGKGEKQTLPGEVGSQRGGADSPATHGDADGAGRVADRQHSGTVAFGAAAPPRTNASTRGPHAGAASAAASGLSERQGPAWTAPAAAAATSTQANVAHSGTSADTNVVLWNARGFGLNRCTELVHQLHADRAPRALE